MLGNLQFPLGYQLGGGQLAQQSLALRPGGLLHLVLPRGRVLPGPNPFCSPHDGPINRETRFGARNTTLFGKLAEKMGD